MSGVGYHRWKKTKVLLEMILCGESTDNNDLLDGGGHAAILPSLPAARERVLKEGKVVANPRCLSFGAAEELQSGFSRPIGMFLYLRFQTRRAGITPVAEPQARRKVLWFKMKRAYEMVPV